MLQLKKTIPSHDQIKNIIFDFGGVICDLDISRTEKKFLEFGPAKSVDSAPAENSSPRFDLLVEQYEKGLISSEEFRKNIRDHYQVPPTDTAIDETWNALLVGIPGQRIHLLEDIRARYRIFLLSNSNEIHYHHYLQDFRQKSGYHDFNDLFEKCYFSFQIHLSKPGKDIFTLVLNENRLEPSQTLFIDDTLKHVETARILGINGYHLDIQNGEQMLDLFA
jgi:putative hydrolase of the HAD superfamily